jgi:hypothetical protein
MEIAQRLMDVKLDPSNLLKSKYLAKIKWCAFQFNLLYYTSNFNNFLVLLGKLAIFIYKD